MKAFVPIAAMVALSGCATTAPPAYQAAGAPGGTGYAAVSVAGGRTAVSYTGNKDMTPVQVARFAMLHAAELTMAAGQQWFAVLQTTTRQVEAGKAADLAARTGPNLTGGSVSAGAGGGRNQSDSAPGVADAAVPGGPTTGGFGGGDVPYQLLERWRPMQVTRTTLLIQMGSGDAASFEGVTGKPEIFAAKDVAAEIHAAMCKGQ